MADLSHLGQIALELLEDMADVAEDVDMEVGEVMIVAELKGDGRTTVMTRCTEDRAWIKLGLLEAASIFERAVLQPDFGDDDGES